MSRLGRGKRVGSLLSALIAASCSGGLEPQDRSRPNVVLITIDTLRRDHLSCYGYKHRTTPFLDRLASEAVRFDRAYSTSSWTLPTIVSILTGLGTAAHGMKDGDSTETGRVIGQPVLGRDLVLMPELLRRHGYQTFGLTANEHLQEDLGFARGFDSYRCVGFEPGETLRGPLREIRRRIDPARPYFLWVHYFDPHAPYDSNRPELRGYLDGVGEVDGALLGRVQSLAATEQFLALDLEKEPDALAYARASYDSDIRLVDGWIEDLFQLLEIGKEDLVVLTADHGEEFYEHGGFGHGHTLFEEQLQIPLIVRLPGARHAGETVENRVSVMDVLPFVLEVAGIERPQHLQGRSLLPLIDHDGAVEDRVIRASTARDREIDSLTIDRWKYIQPIGRPEEAMLFDLKSDPGERTNVIDTHPNEARVLRRALAHLNGNSRGRRPMPESVPFPPERLEAMRSLGYVR